MSQPPRLDNKETTVSFRLEKTKRQELELLKEQHGYSSLSRFLRDAIFCHRMTLKAIPFSAEGIRSGILIYTQQINKIGSNYNQNVRRIHALSETKRKNGDPVICTKPLLNIEEQNKAILEKILKTQDNLLCFIEESVKTIESRIATVFFTSTELKKRLNDALEVPIQNKESEPVSLRQYIMAHDDAYAAFTNLLEIILQVEDYSKEFENNETK